MNKFEFFEIIERYHTFKNPTSEEKLDLATDYCAIRDGMRILDIGSGNGWLLRRIARRFDVRITGLEIHHTFAEQARSMIAADGLRDRIEIVLGPALDFRGAENSFDLVMCIGASFALGGYDNALGWMSRRAKRGGTIAIGEVYANRLPFPVEFASGEEYEQRNLWMTAQRLSAHGLMMRGMVESSIDDWNRYHSLHWRAAMDWVLENPNRPEAAELMNAARQRMDLEVDGRYLGWAIFVARNGMD